MKFWYGVLKVIESSKLQKKAEQYISISKYNAHIDPLFKELKLIKVMDIL